MRSDFYRPRRAYEFDCDTKQIVGRFFFIIAGEMSDGTKCWFKCEKDAEHFIIDLYNRVKGITGEVTNWEGIRLTMGNNFPVLEGMVQGKEGKARVETILAGGYNIQRLHIRTLVHSI